MQSWSWVLPKVNKTTTSARTSSAATRTGTSRVSLAGVSRASTPNCFAEESRKQVCWRELRLRRKLVGMNRPAVVLERLKEDAHPAYSDGVDLVSTSLIEPGEACRCRLETTVKRRSNQ